MFSVAIFNDPDNIHIHMPFEMQRKYSVDVSIFEQNDANFMWTPFTLHSLTKSLDLYVYVYM